MENKQKPQMHKILIKLAKRKEINMQSERSNATLIKSLLCLPFLYRKDINTIVKSISTINPSNKTTSFLLNIIDKYLINDKLVKLGFNKIAKRHIRKNELDRIIYLSDLSDDVLKNLAKLQ